MRFSEFAVLDNWKFNVDFGNRTKDKELVETSENVCLDE
jgi:hypothetical protein